MYSNSIPFAHATRLSEIFCYHPMSNSNALDDDDDDVDVFCKSPRRMSQWLLVLFFSFEHRHDQCRCLPCKRTHQTGVTASKWMNQIGEEKETDMLFVMPSCCCSFPLLLSLSLPSPIDTYFSLSLSCCRKNRRNREEGIVVLHKTERSFTTDWARCSISFS